MKVPNNFITEVIEPSMHNINVWGRQLNNPEVRRYLEVDLEDVEIFRRVLRYFCTVEEIDEAFKPHIDNINKYRTELGMEIYETQSSI